MKRLYVYLTFMLNLVFSKQAMSQVLIPDLLFGINGVINNDSTFSYCSAMDQNNNYYMAGSFAYTAITDYTVLKLQPSGLPDPAFGQSGLSKFGLGFTQQRILDLKIQVDGKIVFVGDLLQSGNNWNAVIGRLNTDGQLDTTFNGTGYAIINVNNQYDSFNSVAIQPDGKIVVGGSTCFGGTYDYKFAAWRFNTDGTPDATFGVSGLYRNVTNGAVHKVLIDGTKIVLGGMLENPDYDYCIIRLNANGTPDPTFASAGKLLIVKPGDNMIKEMIADGTGYIAATSSYSGSIFTSDFKPELFRITSAGAVDLTVFGGGYSTFSQTGYSIEPNAMVKSGNTIIVSGIGFNTGSFGSSNAYDGVFYQTNISNGVLNTANGTNGVVKYGISGAQEQITQAYEVAGGDLIFTGCEGASGNFITRYKVSAVGISEANEDNIHVYPNPADEYLTIENNSTEDNYLRLVDIGGRTAFQSKIEYRKNTIGLETIPAGCYFLQLFTENGPLSPYRVTIIH